MVIEMNRTVERRKEIRHEPLPPGMYPDKKYEGTPYQRMTAAMRDVGSIQAMMPQASIHAKKLERNGYLKINAPLLAMALKGVEKLADVSDDQSPAGKAATIRSLASGCRDTGSIAKAFKSMTQRPEMLNVVPKEKKLLRKYDGKITPKDYSELMDSASRSLSLTGSDLNFTRDYQVGISNSRGQNQPMVQIIDNLRKAQPAHYNEAREKFIAPEMRQDDEVLEYVTTALDLYADEVEKGGPVDLDAIAQQAAEKYGQARGLEDLKRIQGETETPLIENLKTASIIGGYYADNERKMGALSAATGCIAEVLGQHSWDDLKAMHEAEMVKRYESGAEYFSYVDQKINTPIVADIGAVKQEAAMTATRMARSIAGQDRESQDLTRGMQALGWDESQFGDTPAIREAQGKALSAMSRTLMHNNLGVAMDENGVPHTDPKALEKLFEETRSDVVESSAAPSPGAAALLSSNGIGTHLSEESAGPQVLYHLK